jgi:hypothetical protein
MSGPGYNSSPKEDTMTRAEHQIRITGRAGVWYGTWQASCRFTRVWRSVDLDDEYETEMRSMLLRTGMVGRLSNNRGGCSPSSVPNDPPSESSSPQPALTSPATTLASPAVPNTPSEKQERVPVRVVDGILK